MDNFVENAFKDFVETQDHIAAGEGIRDFRQLLGEHAKTILAVAQNYGHPTRQLALMNDQEVLTDIHQEWADRVTRRHDPREWKNVARRSIRSPAHCAAQLVGAYAARSDPGVLSHWTQRLGLAVMLAADFHVNIDANSRASQNGDLAALWVKYGEMMASAIAALASHGPKSSVFYRRAANTMKTAQTLGSTMDTLQLPI